MDDTTQSRTSDVAASAATRKRRSSILKSQRPPRTPFCELEFNVLTPTDTSKSRRVSFSRRTGVAEFVTNEATTTWKNFYEEQNKTFESSGNDSEMNHRKQSIGHLGKRIFDQQFEEVEGVDFMGSLNAVTNISSSINHINFAQLECTDPKLKVSQSKFELSALTETQSRLFGDNLAITCTGEPSGHIDVNFSAIQQIGEKDDLDEIQKDLKRNTNIICQAPFTGQDLSEYIEIDLNMTHAVIANDESNMSMTDTIHSPKVEEVSKNCAIDKKNNFISKDWLTDKENIVLNPYIAPRESINFVVTEVPDEVLVFDGKRLVVETENSKKEICHQPVLSKPSERAPQRKTIILNCNDDLPNLLDEAQISKNQSSSESISEILQSCIVENKPAQHRLDETQNKYKTIIFDDDLDDISVTQAVPNVISNVEKQRTIIYDDYGGNISITQALPSNITSKEKNKTYIYGKDNVNMSMTQAVPVNIIIPNENGEKRKTILFENEACNISMTQAIPANIVLENNITKRRNTYVEDNAINMSVSQSNLNSKKTGKELKRTKLSEDNISVTHSRTSTSRSENNAPSSVKKTTAVFDCDTGDISLTKLLSSNIILAQNRNTTTYEDNGDISMTQGILSNILLQSNDVPNKRRTVVFENDTGNLSITQAVTKNQVIQSFPHHQNELEPKSIEYASDRKLRKDILHISSLNHFSTQESFVNSLEENTCNKQRTIMFQNEAADVSITQVVPVRQVIDKYHVQNLNDSNLSSMCDVLRKETLTTKRNTVVFENEDANISLTSAISNNRVIEAANKEKEKESFNNSVSSVPQEVKLTTSKNNISLIIDGIPEDKSNVYATNMVLCKAESSSLRRTVAVDSNVDTSVTREVSVNREIDPIQRENLDIKVKSTTLNQELVNEINTAIFYNDDVDISITQAVPVKQDFYTIKKENKNIEVTNGYIDQGLSNKSTYMSVTNTVPLNKIINTEHKKNGNNVEKNSGVHKEELSNENIAVIENDDVDTSTTESASKNKVISTIQNETSDIQNTNATLSKNENSNETVILENEAANLCITGAVCMPHVTDSIQIPSQNFEENCAVFDRQLNINNEPAVLKKNDLGPSATKPVYEISQERINESNYNTITQKHELVEHEITSDNRKSMGNKSNIIYDDDEEDISMIRALSSNIILPDGHEKKRTIVVDSVDSLLENKDLFIEIDRLTDGSIINKSNIKAQEREYDISKSDLSNMESYEKNNIKSDNNNKHVTKLIRDDIISIQNKLCITVVESKMKPSEPTHARLLQQVVVDKSHDNKKLDGILLNATSTFTDVLVYQSITSNTQDQLKTDHGDSQVVQEEKVASEKEKERPKSLAMINSQVETCKAEGLNLQNSNFELAAASTSMHHVVKTTNSKLSNSILNELLNMSEVSFEGTEDKKKLMGKISSVLAGAVQSDVNNSTDTLFYITKDSDEDGLIGMSEENPGTHLNTLDLKPIEGNIPLSIEYKDDDVPQVVKDVQTTLSTVKNVLREHHISQFTHSDQNTHDEDKESKVSLGISRRKSHKSFRMANDTNELLEMLSDFTDSRNFRTLKEAQKDPETLLTSESKTKCIEQEPFRFNRTLKRQSTVLSREDLLNNMSMATAALQKSRSDFDESNDVEDVIETPNVSKEQRKSVKLSNDVAKMLHFEDDSIVEASELIQTPLKKTAFGEISYMKETKCKVIPSFLNDVSDGVKELMDDLVKPTSDMQPFNKVPFEKYALKKNVSTCNTQIQTNLLTSSQIDLQTDLYSSPNSVSEMNKFSSTDIITDAVSETMAKALESPLKSTSTYVRPVKSSEMVITSKDIEIISRSSNTAISQTQPIPGQHGNVLIFDQSNPLNNVLLVPTPAHAIDIHRYDPIKPNELQEIQCNEFEDLKPQEDIVSSQYRVELSSVAAVAQLDHMDKRVNQSRTSIASKPISIDHYTEPEISNVRDVEINTAIAMKANDELLQASSSLTLVDDEANRHHVHSPTDTPLMDTASSPVRVIYKVEEPSLTKLDYDLTSTDGIKTPLKSKKRVYSPTKRDKHRQCTLSTLDVTPKPATKMQKRSFSPDYEEPTKLIVEKVEPEAQASREKSPRKIKTKKQGTTITVQQLTTTHLVKPVLGKDGGASQRSELSPSEPRSASGSRSALSRASSSDMTSSFASSKNQRDVTSSGRVSLSGQPSGADWLPMSSSMLTVDVIRTGDDLVGIIDAMPFMGGYECQWECVSGASWSLLLLHARLRLRLRFAGEPRLRPDTRLLDLQLETLHQDKKNPIAYLCVTYAAELMRYYIARGCDAASDVGKLLRRLSGAARLAAQWARAMNDARARLAYSLSHDGWLALKVANTSCRAVWEVTLRLELVVEGARAAPWPCAGRVSVARVLAPAGNAPRDLEGALAGTPRDWGHAPRTIWKVFKYLKHKKREDPLMHL